MARSLGGLLLVLLTIVGWELSRDQVMGVGERLYVRIWGDERLKEVLPPSGKRVWGLDLSHHQRQVDWDRLVANDPPDFIIFKATEGITHKDTRYRNHIREARERGIVCGAYHFFSFRSPGGDQARHFLKVADPGKGDLIPVLDVEYSRRMPSADWIRKEVRAFSKEVERQLGVRPIIYCACDFYRKYLENEIPEHQYWISSMKRKPSCDYVIWQYTDKGKVPGIRGGVDMNRLHPEVSLVDLVLKR